MIDALTARNFDARANAARELGKSRDARAVEPLITALRKDEAPHVRITAAEALGVLRDHRAVDPLVDALRERNKRVRTSAIRALGEIADPRATTPLVAVLADNDMEMRFAAVDALHLIDDPRAAAATFDTLTTTLTGKDGIHRSAAARRLGESGDVRALEPLVAALRGDREWFVRSEAAAALGKLREPRAVEPLVVSLSDKILAKYAIGALGAIATPRAIEALVSALEDLPPDPPALQALALWDPKEAPRKARAELIRIGAPAVDALLAGLRTRGRGARVLAIEALVAIGDARSVEPLIAMLSDSQFEIRAATARFLGKLEDNPIAMAGLDGALGDPPNLPVIASAHRYFVRKGRAGSEPLLVAALNQFGDKTVAEDFINCGNDELAKAGSAWASRHGYKVTRLGRSDGPRWGR